jgi:hypothetical protein
MHTKSIKNFLSLFPECYLVLIHDKEDNARIERLRNKPDLKKAERFNNLGYAVFFTPNGHKGGWKEKNLTKINSWYVDIDKGTKEKQLVRIKNSPIKPSLIIESKNGFHVYWFAKNATKENFSLIEDRLVDFFNADNIAKKISQLLRVPYFNHNKTHKSFKVKIVKLNKQLVYSENAMLEAFKPLETETPILEIAEPILTVKKQPRPKETHLKAKSGLHKELALAYPSEFAHGIDKANSKRHLDILSGSHFVRGETYSFKSNRDGTYQIIVNGKSSSCWIRKDGSIGSLSGGSPSIIQWIRWFEF